LDRLSRNLAFIAALMDSAVEFVAVDNPHATRLTLHILAAVAEHERQMIGERTKAALQAAKARGIRLGRNGADRLAPANRADAIERARQLAPVLSELKPLACLRGEWRPYWRLAGLRRQTADDGMLKLCFGCLSALHAEYFATRNRSPPGAKRPLQYFRPPRHVPPGQWPCPLPTKRDMAAIERDSAFVKGFG
jgi:hypothetical protein